MITGFRIGSGGAQAMLRRARRPDDVRQGDRRRAPDRRRRRPRARSWRRSRRSGRVPRRHAGRQPARHGRRAGGTRTSSNADVYAELTRRADAAGVDARRDACAGGRLHGSRSRSSATLVGMYCVDRRPAGRLRRRQADRRSGLRPVLPRHARRGRGDGAGCVRGAVRRAARTPTTMLDADRRRRAPGGTGRRGRRTGVVRQIFSVRFFAPSVPSPACSCC